MDRYNNGVWEGMGVFQQHSELTIVSKLASDQINDLKALCGDECSTSGNFLTVEKYKYAIYLY